VAESREHDSSEDLYLVCDNHCLPPVIGLVVSQFHDLKVSSSFSLIHIFRGLRYILENTGTSDIKNMRVTRKRGKI
jgi:hypothetical protein